MKDRILKRFNDEIATLERELKVELPKEIQRARELGDLRENAEYKAAKERQEIVNARIAMLKKRVGEISLINLDRMPHDRAGFGSTVHLRAESGDTIVYQLVMPEEADAEKGMISTSSPIGRAILNKEEGRRDQGHDPERRQAVRAHQAHHDPRRGVDRAAYSPERRTALVLCGTGVHGAYHAGVLRALQEAGVKIDVIAGQGIGAGAAALAAIDGAARLWDADGLWRTPGAARLYGWTWPRARRRLDSRSCWHRVLVIAGARRRVPSAVGWSPRDPGVGGRPRRVVRGGARYPVARAGAAADRRSVAVEHRGCADRCAARTRSLHADHLAADPWSRSD